MSTIQPSSLYLSIVNFCEVAREANPSIFTQPDLGQLRLATQDISVLSPDAIKNVTQTVASAFVSSRGSDAYAPVVDSWRNVLNTLALSPQPDEKTSRRVRAGVSGHAFAAAVQAYNVGPQGYGTGKSLFELSRAHQVDPGYRASNIGYTAKHEFTIAQRDFDMIDVWRNDPNANVQRSIIDVAKKYFCSTPLSKEVRRLPEDHFLRKLYESTFELSIKEFSPFVRFDVFEKLMSERQLQTPDDRPLAVVIHPNVPDYKNTIYLHNQLLTNVTEAGFRTMYFQVGNSATLISNLEAATKDEPAHLVAIYADVHGDRLQLGSNHFFKAEEIAALAKKISDRIVNGGVVAIMGPNTALSTKTLVGGIAGEFSRALPHAFVIGTTTELFADLQFSGTVKDEGFKVLMPHMFGVKWIPEYKVLQNGKVVDRLPDQIGFARAHFEDLKTKKKAPTGKVGAGGSDKPSS